MILPQERNLWQIPLHFPWCVSWPSQFRSVRPSKINRKTEHIWLERLAPYERRKNRGLQYSMLPQEYHVASHVRTSLFTNNGATARPSKFFDSRGMTRPAQFALHLLHIGLPSFFGTRSRTHASTRKQARGARLLREAPRAKNILRITRSDGCAERSSRSTSIYMSLILTELMRVGTSL